MAIEWGLLIPPIAVSGILGLLVLFYSWRKSGVFLRWLHHKDQGHRGHDQDTPLSLITATHNLQEEAIHVQDVEAQRAHVIAQAPPSILRWMDVGCVVMERSGVSGRRILQGCCGEAGPGELVAIVGPSGAGKSTLLDILAQRKCGAGIEGHITVNGTARRRNLKKLSTYVPQDDTFVPTLTVWETLAVATLLRVPGHITKADRHALMYESLQSMGLVKVMHSQVGGLLSGGIFIRGLSGGERRRLNIACGVVGAPAIIFLDEPTTGLDSYSALVLVQHMRDLAAQQRTIIASVHQPRVAIWDMFNKVEVLSEGCLLYFGPTSKVTQWFKDGLAYTYNPLVHGTPCDWVLDLVSVGFQNQTHPFHHGLATYADVVRASTSFRERGLQMYLSDDFEMQCSTSLDSVLSTPPPSPTPSYYRMSDAERRTENPASCSPFKEHRRCAEKFRDAGKQTVILMHATSLLVEPSAQSFDVARLRSTQSLGPGGITGRMLRDFAAAADCERKNEARALTTAEENPEGLPCPLLTSGSHGSSGGSTDGEQASNQKYSVGWWRQYRVLLWRSLMSYTRNPSDVAGRIFMAIGTSLVGGLVFINSVKGPGSVPQTLAALFFSVFVIGLTPFAYMSLFIADKQLFAAEAGSRLYHTTAYYLAMVTANLPFTILNGITLCLSMYAIIGLRKDVAVIWMTVAIAAVHSLIGVQFMVLSAFVAPNQDLAFVIAVTYSAFNILLAGFLVRIQDLIVPLRVLSYGMFTHFTFEAFVTLQYSDRGSGCPAKLPSSPTPETFGAAITSDKGADPCESLLDYYGFKLTPGECLACLITLLGVLHLISYVGLDRVRRRITRSMTQVLRVDSEERGSE